MAAAVAAADTGAHTRFGKVKNVFDGDTVELASGEVIRLLGIDAPESNRRNRNIPSQPFFLESRDALAALVGRKKVLLKPGIAPVGRYGRTLAYLHLQDGTDVQLEMLRGGHAMMTAYPPDLAHLGVYSQVEAEARRNRTGMWGDPYFAVQPLARGVPRKDGPARVSGVITSVSTTGKRIKITVSESLTLQIQHPAWHRYWRPAEAQHWVGKRAVAQGRIRSKSKTMHITHPAMLRIGGAE